jgi:hypothetical protein
MSCRISGYFLYPVSSKSNHVSGQILDIKKAGLSGRMIFQPDICCIPFLHCVKICELTDDDKWRSSPELGELSF